MKKDKYTFVTSFDSANLIKGIVMIVYLHRHEDNARLYAVCIDDLTFQIITALGLTNVRPVSLAAIEKCSSALAEAKHNSTKEDYHTTLTQL